MRATARERSRAFSFSEVIMPVVDERLIAKAMALRKQGRTQEEIAVELVAQGTVSTTCASTALAGASRWRTSGLEGHEPANQTVDHRTWGHGDAAWRRGADTVAFLTPAPAMAQIA